MTEQQARLLRLPEGTSRQWPRAALLLKRSIDLGIALPLGLVLSPLFLLVALAIKLDSRGPVFFRQERRGLGFRKFTILKFRSLRHAAPDPHGRYEMNEHDPRITRVGEWIRRTSLDELPQLLNVIAGSMSLVGPRPLVEWESRDCIATHPERFLVKPGITGLSQIHVRNAVDLDARSDWDVEYVRRWSVS
jgi:lipopolysaccharide/colanic/teichoic acid biosynthesis glycosyltransferase